MIRGFAIKDLDAVMRIWLKSNIDTHHFVSEDYWYENAIAVKGQLQNAEIYVYEYDNEIVGFIGLQDNYLAGIFVDKKFRSFGVGKQLLNYVKEIHETLSLHVCRENTRAVNFYLREGFRIISESLDEATGHVECWMSFTK